MSITEIQGTLLVGAVEMLEWLKSVGMRSEEVKSLRFDSDRDALVAVLADGHSSAVPSDAFWAWIKNEKMPKALAGLSTRYTAPEPLEHGDYCLKICFTCRSDPRRTSEPDSLPEGSHSQRGHTVMTPAQFDTVAEMLRSRDPVRAAVRQVLIDGESNKRAADGAGLRPQSVSNALRRYRSAHTKLLAAYAP